MKKLFPVLMLLCSLSAIQPVFAQETYTVKFDYDNAGNRIMRWIDITRLKETDSVPADFKIPVTEYFTQTKLYPNPTYGGLTIDMEVDTEHPVSFLLADMHGKNLLTGTIRDRKTTLNLEAYKPGIYFIRLDNDLGSAIFKIVKH